MNLGWYRMISNLKHFTFVTSGLLLITKYSTGNGSETGKKRIGRQQGSGGIVVLFHEIESKLLN